MKRLQDRKNEHISLCLNGRFGSAVKNGFDRYQLEHNALPELSFDEIDTSVKFLGKELSMPLLISSITGGGSAGVDITKKLAELAEEFCIGLAVGSQRVAVESHDYTDFKIRKYAPGVLLFANLGAVQLNYGFGIEQAKAAVDMLEADALMLHLNPLQEVFQPEGNRNFSQLLEKIEDLCHSLEVPVIIKEVGYGISCSTAKKLHEAGVKIIDVAGAGSVSWSSIEAERSNNQIVRDAAETFRDWGNPTAFCVEEICKKIPEVTVIASGGITNGVEIAKALVLGAEICGNASTFLRKISDSVESCKNFIKTLHFELKTAMFCTGAGNICDLKKTRLRRIFDLQ